MRARAVSGAPQLPDRRTLQVLLGCDPESEEGGQGIALRAYCTLSRYCFCVTVLYRCSWAATETQKKGGPGIALRAYRTPSQY